MMETKVETTMETALETTPIAGWKHGNKFPTSVSSRKSLHSRAISIAWKQRNTFAHTPPIPPLGCASLKASRTRLETVCAKSCFHVSKRGRFTVPSGQNQKVTRAGTAANSMRLSFLPVFPVASRRGGFTAKESIGLGKQDAPYRNVARRVRGN